MESKKINQLATELAPELSDLTIIGDPTTGISKKITLSQMASLFTGTVEEYANLASFPLVGTADTIYIALDTNIIYRWNTGTSAYVELSPNIVTSLVFSDANGFDGTISLVGSTATLTITTALTQGSVPFIGASGALSQDNANLFFDDTNNRLGINTNTPTTALDVFGSGIIGRLNGTSTNNAFLGFSSAGSNKWSIGNVQSDHRFRIYNEATTSELVSVLQTGEFGIGIANPLTKLHIFGGASALIANLDANTSVAKSISFRSGNSSRFNIEVSGTESGSNAGMDFYLRAYTDAGALLSTPLTISRSTGAVTLSSSLSATGATFTSTQTNLVLNTTTNTSFTKLSFQENGSEKATITYPNSTFGAPTRREKLEISNLGGISFITQNAPLTPNMSITSAGNVGIGTSSPSTRLHIVSGQSSIPDLYIQGAGSGQGWLGFGTANDYGIQGGADYLGIIFRANSAERMRITSSGNVGIGTTSPDRLLHLASTQGTLKIQSNSTSGANIPTLTFFHAGNDEFIISGGDGLRFLSSGVTERMRITGGGDLLIGTTTAGNASKFTFDGGAGRGGIFQNSNTGAHTLQVNNSSGSYADLGGGMLYINQSGGASETGFRAISVYTNSGARFAVRGDGTIYSTNTSVQSISDVRFKENIKNIDTGLNEILKLQPRRFDWKKGKGTGEKNVAGFIAQEIENIFPELVSEFKDDINDETLYKSVGYSGLIPTLVKAIQEQNEIITKQGQAIEELKALINK